MRTIKIGILQQHNTADKQQNITRLASGIADLAQRGAQLIVLQELHNTLYFCQEENVDYFNLAETIPGPSTEFYGELAKKHHVVIVTSLFEKRAAGLYHNTAVVIESDRCTSPTTQATTRNSISALATWDSSQYKPHLANSVCSYAGINGIPKQPA